MGAMRCTASTALQRVTAGMSTNAGQLAAKSISPNAAKPPRNKSATQMTANEPTCESFKIRCRSGKSRRDKIASQQSIKPSRWIKPVRRYGAAVKTAAASASVYPSAQKPHIKSAQIPPVSSPTTGRYTSIQPRAASSHLRYGHGIAQNIPHAIKNAVICFFMPASLLCTTAQFPHTAPPRPHRFAQVFGRRAPDPRGSAPSSRHRFRRRRR